jgi:hypothetical protein
LLLYSSNLALGVFQLAGYLLHTIKLSDIIITAPSHNNEIKMIRSGHYSSNNFQDSNKRKNTKKENNGLSPKSAFL